VEPGRAARVGIAIARHPREFVGLLMATTATGWIFANALFMQKGPHPAPIFSARPAHRAAVTVAPQRVLPAPAPAAGAPVETDRTRLVGDIQRELENRGFYDGAIDGLWGAKTDAAVRDFVQASGGKVAPEASDALLRAIKAAPAKQAVAAQRSNDPIAALIAPKPRVLAIQRALTDFAYGPVALTGVYDPKTRAAIERFQRARGLPIDGQISDGLVRELSGLLGRPLE
jgi:peptidoglycan hydrolase-like protein with peptidoglycan-binding domain